MKVLSDDQCKRLNDLLYTLETDALRHYPPFTERISEVRTLLWLFGHELPVLGEVS